MTNKLFLAEVKTFGDPALGQFTFYASTFGKLDTKTNIYGPPDKSGDVMKPGAFDDTLAQLRTAGKRLPTAFAHAFGGGNVPGADPFAIIGSADINDVVVDEHGLFIKSQLDMENPVAQQVHRLMKQGLVDQASFTFQVQQEKVQRDRSRLIEKVALYEAGPCLIGVNGEAEVLAVKASMTGDDAVEAVETEEVEVVEVEVPVTDELRKDIELAAYRMRLMRSDAL